MCGWRIPFLFILQNPIWCDCGATESWSCILYRLQLNFWNQNQNCVNKWFPNVRLHAILSALRTKRQKLFSPPLNFAELHSYRKSKRKSKRKKERFPQSNSIQSQWVKLVWACCVFWPEILYLDMLCNFNYPQLFDEQCVVIRLRFLCGLFVFPNRCTLMVIRATHAKKNKEIRSTDCLTFLYLWDVRSSICYINWFNKLVGFDYYSVCAFGWIHFCHFRINESPFSILNRKFWIQSLFSMEKKSLKWPFVIESECTVAMDLKHDNDDGDSWLRCNLSYHSSSSSSSTHVS